jgi:hypothetical protein
MAFETILKYKLNGLNCAITLGSGYGGFNGYITYKKRPLKESGYYGIVTYIPVHGGITYTKQEEDGSFTYGFDTSHCDSMKYPIKDIEWIKGQIKVIYNSIKLCKKLEKEYLLNEGNNEKRAEICQKVLDVNKDMETSFGVNIKLLAGKL